MKKRVSALFITFVLIAFLFSFSSIQAKGSGSDSSRDSDVNSEARDGRIDLKSTTDLRTREEFELHNRTELTENQREQIIRMRNRLRFDSDELPENCKRNGSVLICEINGTRILTVHAGNSGNIIVQVKDSNASTNVTLYKSDDGKLYGVFRDNETREIILPDEARDRIKTRVQARLENESINLTEEGRYEFRARKEARLFFLFKVREDVRAEVDAETGEVLRTGNPWWGFLAKDTPEDTTNSSEQQ